MSSPNRGGVLLGAAALPAAALPLPSVAAVPEGLIKPDIQAASAALAHAFRRWIEGKFEAQRQDNGEDDCPGYDAAIAAVESIEQEIAAIPARTLVDLCIKVYVAAGQRSFGDPRLLGASLNLGAVDAWGEDVSRSVVTDALRLVPALARIAHGDDASALDEVLS